MIWLEKLYFIGQGIIFVATTIFIVFLRRYNRSLAEIQEMYDSPLLRAWRIMEDPYYLRYLIAGLFFIVLLISFAIKSFKVAIEDTPILLINVLVSLILLIILLVVFWNPILTTLAVIALGFGVLAYAK